MKKLVMAAAAFIIAAAPVYADENISSADKITIEQQAGMADTIIVTGYDSDGVLKYASQAKAENGSYTIEIQPELTSVKLFDMNGTVYEINPNPDTAPGEEPQESTPPETTSQPSEKPETTAQPTVSPASTRKPLNPSYTREIDQATAPGIVTEVASETNGGEDYCALTVLMQGQEIKVPVYDDKVIENAPQAYSFMKGQQAYSLKKGDVVYFRTNISGDTVRGIDLIYRPSDIMKGTPTFAEFFNSGSVASQVYAGGKLTNDRTYVMGIIADKGNNILKLYSGDGKRSNSFDIDYTNKTVTYIYDMASKADPYIASANEIEKSTIPRIAYDEDDNITYSSEYDYNAALVRVVDKTAVDIIVFENIENTR